MHLNVQVVADQTFHYNRKRYRRSNPVIVGRPRFETFQAGVARSFPYDEINQLRHNADLKGVCVAVLSKIPKDYSPEPVIVVNEPQKGFDGKSYEELKRMTKDELNDYAALQGWNEVNSSMLKAEMIDAILVKQAE